MEQPGAREISSREPKIELLAIKEDFVKFVIWDTDVSVANALRRIMIGETPTMAIDLVTIEENTSVLHDEYLAHRLGLIPIRVNTDDGVRGYKYKHDCFCDDFCPSCSIEFLLDVVNDGEEDVKIITSEDLRPLGSAANNVEAVLYSSAEEYQFTTEQLQVPRPGITIAKLAPGQRIKCRCIALKGTSKIHAKWSPVSVATFAYDPVIELNDALTDELTEARKKDFVESCPVKVFEIDGTNGKIFVKNREKCMFCDECVRISDNWRENAEADPYVTIGTEPNRFIFSVETTGSLKPEEVVFNALTIIQNKLQFLNRKVDDIIKNDGEEVILPESQVGRSDTGGFL